MGLDLTINEQHDITTDEKGRTTWQVTCLGNFRNCWNLFNLIQNRTNLNNCSTVDIGGDELKEILDDIREDIDENDSPKLRKELEEELEYVEQVIKDGEIQLDNEHTYEIHAWW